MPGQAKHGGHEADGSDKLLCGIHESDGNNACVESSDNDTAHDSLLQAMPGCNDIRICKRAASGFL